MRTLKFKTNSREPKTFLRMSWPLSYKAYATAPRPHLAVSSYE